MAKMIVIEEKHWKKLCDALCRQLELENLRHPHTMAEATVEGLHRQFNYYVVNFFRDVENA